METDGVDFSANFGTNFRNLEFRALLDVTYLNNYKSGSLIAGQVDLTGKADGMVGVFPEWKATVDFGLAGSSWSADLIFRYMSECDDLYRTPLLSADATAEAMLYTDLVGTYTWNQLRITAGINNVLDEDPPYFHNAFNANTEPGMYDVIGRRLFISATYEF
jgi:iron complex outermembrane receptor protein